MPSIRIGFSTDFNLTSEQVGIGTTLPSARLDVAGQILSDNSSGSGGVSTVTRYDGFLGSEQRLSDNVSIGQTSKGNLNSLSGEIILDNEITVTDGTPLTGGRLDSLTVTGKFDLPQGGTEDREDTPEKGSTRFNQDLGQLEFYTGYEWRTVNSYADSGGRGRGVFAGGYSPTSTVLGVIDYINISSTGNAINFGTLNTSRRIMSGCSSSIRGIFGGGATPSVSNAVDYITIASDGNAISFGNLTSTRYALGSCSSSTRGVFGGGITPTYVNTIDYVTISTLGNAISFGNLDYLSYGLTACSSPTRGIFAGGQGSTSPYPDLANISLITISSTGNSVNFGNLTSIRYDAASSANSITGIFAGGGVIIKNVIDYITIATAGNAINFGDLTVSRRSLSSAATQVRAVFGGGYSSASPATRVNTIDYITITSKGNAQDFGDLTVVRAQNSGCSDSHGGLGGF